MSCELHALLPVSFYGYNQHYDNLAKIENDIEENLHGREDAVKALYKYAYMTDPKVFMSNDCEETPEEWLDKRLEAIIQDIETVAVENYKLGLLKEYWGKCHMNVNGKTRAITLPEEMLTKKPIYDWAFLEGDFTNSVYPDGKERNDL